MHPESDTTRRRFFLMAAGAAAGPLALASTAAVAEVRDDASARLAELVDYEALRALHERIVAHVNAGLARPSDKALFTKGALIELDETVRRLDFAGHGAALAIERKEDGTMASLRARHLVRIETELQPDCTEARMAIAQGCGTVRRAEERVVRIDCVKLEGDWKVRRLSLAAKEVTA